jgi:adenylosuccinate synthase
VDSLPVEVNDFITFLTSRLGVPAGLLSFGPDREATLRLR